MQQARGSLPVYLTIAEGLARDIAAGRLRDGEKLLPERDLAAELGVAVGTLRKALAELQTRGLIQSRQGSGNYIRAVPDLKSVYALFRLEGIGGGGLPTARVLSVSRLSADLPGHVSFDTAHRIRRLRYLDDLPVAVEEIWLDGALIPRLSAADLSDSLYLFYRQKLGVTIGRAEDQVTLGQVPRWAPPEFGKAVGTVLPLVDRITQDSAGRRIEVSQSWFDHDLARYVARLG